MGEVVESLAKSFSEVSGISVAVSPAASGFLRKQIEAGAGCDVFIAADVIELDKLDEQGLLRADSRRTVALSRLVLIGCGARPPPADLATLADAATGRIALGDPAYVPAGRYAVRALEVAGVWSAVQPRAILADNVRVACEYVRSEQADFGLVYAADAALMPDCRVHLEIDESLTGPIEFPGAVLEKSRHPAAERFLQYVVHPDQSAVWARHGYDLPAASKED